MIGPEAETEIFVLEDGTMNADFAFRITVVSTIGWESAMALAPRARRCVEGLEALAGVTFTGFDRGDYLLSFAEGSRPVFAKALRYRVSTTLG